MDFTFLFDEIQHYGKYYKSDRGDDGELVEHGFHTVSLILTEESFCAAADSTAESAVLALLHKNESYYDEAKNYLNDAEDNIKSLHILVHLPIHK